MMSENSIIKDTLDFRVVVCIGGHGILVSDIEVYAFALDEWNAYPPLHTGFPPIRYANLISFNQTLYIMGGFDLSISQGIDKMFTFDPETTTVSLFGTLQQVYGEGTVLLFNL